MSEINFFVKKFNELSIDELYEILRLRTEIFVVEQDCVYQDLDNKDQKALHVIGVKEGNIVAYTRLFDAGAYFDNASLGRVIVAADQRKFSYGHQLIEESLKAIKRFYATDTITISAQLYLKKFYEKHGFLQKGDTYLEDGIPHIKMIRSLQN
ncbi:GNAT family N-acetyltransferase [Aquimarina intermedia]|uniref:ElaA protein n=1 Tax=Aquimarina intermedia TaxID=350814 RepID=A0A5S5CCN0_9FLAO|nr:ElaA protein [Aquimarina intermedia]